jgi:iron(III) transport system permease protein
MSAVWSAGQARRRARAGSGWLQVSPVLAILFFLVPIVSLAWIAFSGGSAAFPRLDVIGDALVQTALLLTGVAVISAGIAVPLAWAVARFEFPFRRQIEVLSVLPLALPAYLAAYAFVDLTDFFGPLQSGLRGVFGAAKLPWFPDLRSLPGACFVMALTLYPYVYLPARWSFERQSARQIEAARSLGAGARELLFKIALPLAWPSIVAGLTLALLETMNDIGATQYLGVQSLTVVTFTTWTVRDNLPGAAQLALLLLVIVAILIAVEARSRRARHYADPSRQITTTDRLFRRGAKGWFLSAGCALPFLLGFVAPASQLIARSVRDLAQSGFRDETLMALFHTLVLAGSATCVILLIGFGLVLLKRLRDGLPERSAVRLSALGYGVPGVILVLGLMPLAGAIDQMLFAGGLIRSALLSGSFVIVIIAYALRFTAIASSQADAAMKRLSRNVDHAAATLGATRMGLVSRILTPQMVSVAGAAAILVAVDCIKELPATLLLRPLNVETLSTLVYEAASRGAFEEGAVAATLIVLISLVPLTVLFRLITRNA